jgi:hypothetical protein
MKRQTSQNVFAAFCLFSLLGASFQAGALPFRAESDGAAVVSGPGGFMIGRLFNQYDRTRLGLLTHSYG